MSQKKLIASAAALVVAVVVSGTGGSAQAASDAGAESVSWTSDPVPVTNLNLVGAAQPDARTTWAAGFTLSSGKGSDYIPPAPVLLSRDDARGWVAAPTAPLPSGTVTRFNAVAAASGQDGWLVGDDGLPGGGIVAEHWNGTAWQLLPAAEPADTYLHSGGFYGVSGRGPADAWAVGTYTVRTGTTTAPDGSPEVVTQAEGLAEHWDGTAWREQRLPPVPGGFWLNGVTEIGPDDVWAVGNTADGSDQPVLMHYDGRSWRQVPTPHYVGRYGEFDSVTATGPDDVWVAGRTVLTETDQGHGLVVHWDGHQWRQVPVPAAAGGLFCVTATPSGVVATGRTSLAPYPGPGADGYAMRYTSGAFHSLGLPTGTLFDPHAVTVSPAGVTTVAGNVSDPAQPVLKPMILTSTD